MDVKSTKTLRKEIHYKREKSTRPWCGQRHAENFTENIDNITCKKCLSEIFWIIHSQKIHEHIEKKGGLR